MSDERTYETTKIKRWPESHAVRETAAPYTSWFVRPPRKPNSMYLAALTNLTGDFSVWEKSEKRSMHEYVLERLTKGISISAFESLRSMLDVSKKDLSDTIHVNLRTLSRRTTLEFDESERLMRIAEAFQHALDVFESVEHSREWFRRPKKALGGKTPFEMCGSDIGAKEVNNLLGRIEHGVYS